MRPHNPFFQEAPMMGDNSLFSSPIFNYVYVSYLTVRIMSLHFFGVSSAFPARTKQHVDTTYRLNSWNPWNMKNRWKYTAPVAMVLWDRFICLPNSIINLTPSLRYLVSILKSKPFCRDGVALNSFFSQYQFGMINYSKIINKLDFSLKMQFHFSLILNFQSNSFFVAM